MCFKHVQQINQKNPLLRFYVPGNIPVSIVLILTSYFQGVSEFKSADLKHDLTSCQCSLFRYDEVGSSWKSKPNYDSYNLHSSYHGAVAYVKTEKGFYHIPKPSPSATYAVLLGEWSQ